nr:hypothetical protein REQ54_02191 [Rhizobium sp. Q54]
MDQSGQPEAFDPLAVDLALFGCWEVAPAYREALPDGDVLAEDVRALVLETKSAEGPQVSAAEELRRLLNEMTVEMRGQFDAFRAMRVAAERLLESGDETAGKLARADIKAATDAMSLIVRTLEKVDSLQRQLARDRADEAERAAEASGYGEAKERFIQMIKDRADENAFHLYEAWKRDGPPAWVLERLGDQARQPTDDQAAKREASGQDGEGVVGHGPGLREDCRGPGNGETRG